MNPDRRKPQNSTPDAKTETELQVFELSIESGTLMSSCYSQVLTQLGNSHPQSKLAINKLVQIFFELDTNNRDQATVADFLEFYKDFSSPQDFESIKNFKPFRANLAYQFTEQLRQALE